VAHVKLDLVATSTFGLEAVVMRELATLGHADARSPQTGRVEFSGDATALVRANIWLRSADRILVRVARREGITDFDTLLDLSYELPWEEWIAPDAAFPVAGRSIKSGLASVPAVQRTVKKAIAERLLRAHRCRHLPESGATVAVEAALLKDCLTLTIDSSGPGLHKRGYRDLTAAAPLRETLAAALVELSFWKRDRPLIDPFCGSGTIAIEAAMIGRNMAPGLRRGFAAEEWDAIDQRIWHEQRRAAEAAVQPPMQERIIATDLDEQALSMARRHAERAGVAEDIHFQRLAFHELSSSRKYGCLITNPPYGIRMEDRRDVLELYESMPEVFERLPTWSFFILTSWPGFEQVVGRRAERRRKLYNAQIECTYYQFHGPRP